MLSLLPEITKCDIIIICNFDNNPEMNREKLMNESTQITYGNGTITILMNSESGTEVAAPAIRFGDYQQAVMASFSGKELSVIEEGTNAGIELNFRMVDELEDMEIQHQLEDSLSGFEAVYGPLHKGVFFEVEAEKTLDMMEYTELESFSEDVELQFDIPLYLVGEDRNYYVVNDVMGVCEIEEDIDEDAVTLSVGTHNLSTALLVYQEKSEALKANTQKVHIKAQYLFAGAIVLLLLIWFLVDRRYKKDRT